MPSEISIFSAIAQDIMSANDIGGSSIVGQVFSEYQKSREKHAKEILFKRISEAEIEIIEAAEQDDLISVIYAYFQAAMKGAARANLDLLSQAITGEMKRDRIYPDRFLKYANILSTLTRDEIFVTGVYARCRKKILAEAEGKPELHLGVIEKNTWTSFIAELVPQSFPTEEHVKVTLGSLSRTGLIRTLTTTMQEVGEPAFTILLDEITGLIDFEKSYTQYPDY